MRIRLTLGHILGHLRNPRHRCGTLLTDVGLRKQTYHLVGALFELPASAALPSISARLNLDIDLFLLMVAISRRDLNARCAIPLLHAVLTQKPDDVVWNHVYQLLAKSMPPPSSPQSTRSAQQPSWMLSGESLANTYELSEYVDPILKHEVNDSITINHPDVLDTFFGQNSQVALLTKIVFDGCKKADPPLFQDGDGWADWPKASGELGALKFLRSHISQFLSIASKHGFQPAKPRYCVRTLIQHNSTPINIRKLDVGIADGVGSIPKEGHQQNYASSHILVPGELKSNPGEDAHSTTWLDLVNHVREIFNAQGRARRFVLGFTMCGPTMRLWECDRLGVVGSTPFDINQEGEKFIMVILGFLWMSDEELGFDPTVVEDTAPYMDIQRNGATERIRLGEQIRLQRSMVGRATTCWIGHLDGKPDHQLVIKDSWQFTEQPEEGLLLKEATDAGVKNVARYYHHETVLVENGKDDVLMNVRKGLSRSGGRNPFSQLQPSRSDSGAGSGTSSLPGTSRDEASSTIAALKRERSSGDAHGLMSSPKRTRLSSPATDNPPPRNRIHRRLFMQDVGKDILSASSPRGILVGLLGGLKGHESLLDANILHRDISMGNIVLNMAEDDGFLIDLDLAIKIDRDTVSGAPSQIGTKAYMAVGALNGEQHSFMHDLEYFFWVLFWICMHCTGPQSYRTVEEWERWNFFSTTGLAMLKLGLVIEEDKFTAYLEEYMTSYCTPLTQCLQALRKVVFSDGKRWRTEDRQLYERMRDVFQSGIDSLGV
ncbi:hypothetical protein K491DRAFT_614914 [Lophiostoma macrostomum CBS 122681]|uniref:non-specific serine/threonine protein kinase n=1 Tax=Lophiostoma macrostomum CBS 122681 TaxID=1314788 RepID=A0A6A6SM39_9PLEO|nr:hypothetical protein K491DRAFT_614914 [Lophiostoma macrostomum CBS 122681]